MEWRQAPAGIKGLLEALFAGNLEIGLAIIIVATIAVAVVTVIDRRQGRVMAADNSNDIGSASPSGGEKDRAKAPDKPGVGAAAPKPAASADPAKPAGPGAAGTAGLGEPTKPAAGSGTGLFGRDTSQAAPAAPPTPSGNQAKPGTETPKSQPGAITQPAMPGQPSKPGEPLPATAGAASLPKPPGLTHLLGGAGPAQTASPSASPAPPATASAATATRPSTLSSSSPPPDASTRPASAPSALQSSPVAPSPPSSAAPQPAGAPFASASQSSVPSFGSARAAQPAAAATASSASSGTSPGTTGTSPMRQSSATSGSPPQPAAAPPGSAPGGTQGQKPTAPIQAAPSPAPASQAAPSATSSSPPRATPAAPASTAKPANPDAKPAPEILPSARLAPRKDDPAASDDRADDAALSLDGTALAPLDRVFPARPVPFIALVVALSASAWIVGYVLAPDKSKFLASVEWRCMPFYLAAHLIAVRLFVTAYTRNFRAGVQHLEMPPARAARGVRTILGPFGLLLAILIAAPFCYLDWQYLNRPESRYERMGTGNSVGPIDQLMWGTWCIEWTLNALIWVMLIGFLIKNVAMIRAYAFRAPIELVLHERHYRPFLLMSSQGASIVLGFSAATIFYLWYTGGELTDYAGLAITATLLLIGFFPPWLLLRRKVRRAVEAETLALRHAVLSVMWRDARAKKDGAAAAPIPLEQRLSEALAIFRVSHLEQLKLNLGQREARAVIFRLLAPVLGVAWQMSQSFDSLLLRFDTFMKVAKGLLTRFLL